MPKVHTGFNTDTSKEAALKLKFKNQTMNASITRFISNSKIREDYTQVSNSSIFYKLSPLTYSQFLNNLSKVVLFPPSH